MAMPITTGQLLESVREKASAALEDWLRQDHKYRSRSTGRDHTPMRQTILDDPDHPEHERVRSAYDRLQSKLNQINGPEKSTREPAAGDDRTGRPAPQGDGGQPGNRGGGETLRATTPLAGAPKIKGATGPDPRVVAIAEKYAEANDIKLTRQTEYAKIDKDRAERIADAYEKMHHDPKDPAVAEAYKNLIQQTLDQYHALVEGGYEFYFFDDKSDPYTGSPWAAMRDLRQNQRMAVYATEAGFGTLGELDVSQNPMLEDTGLEWAYGAPDGPKKRVLANDLFRAVHDCFGHAIEGSGFRARGEENAWQAHVRLFKGSAVAAITTETRGQNSWLNYGPYGEKNRTAKVEDTVFAEQKTGLLPSWVWKEGVVESLMQKLKLLNF